MNKETYEALKRFVDDYKSDEKSEYKTKRMGENLSQVEKWIDEVAKEYEEADLVCERCSENISESEATQTASGLILCESCETKRTITENCLHNWDNDQDPLAICKTCGVIKKSI